MTFPFPRFVSLFVFFLCLSRNPLPQDYICHDITRLTGNDSTLARPVPSMWHSTTAHRPICQHNQKVTQQSEEKGITYPIHAREGKTFRITNFRFTSPSEDLTDRRKRTCPGARSLCRIPNLGGLTPCNKKQQRSETDSARP